jgi:Domain of unknown function (DUF4359)
MIQNLNPKKVPPTSRMPTTSRPLSLLKALAGGVLFVGVGALVWTNPEQSDYESYLTAQATGFLRREICDSSKELPAFLHQMAEQHCGVLAASDAEAIRQFVAANSYRHNFYIFSLYTTDLPLRQIKAIGMVKNFYLFDPS